jgi:DNA-binding transcriptional LysR family regulator
MAMNLNNLKIFIHVADSSSITRAAEALFISQPAVSKAIHSIEQELGVDLFIRDKKTGIQLTDVGEKILPYARQMMLMEEKIHQTAYLSRNMLAGSLSIASLPIGIDHVLVKALARFRKNYPGVNVQILEGSTNEISRMILEHEAEFGISLFPAEGFQSEILLKDRIVAISKDELPEKTINLKKSKRQFLICRSAWEVVHPILPPNAIQNYTITGTTTVRRMVQEDLGIGIQSQLLVEPEKEFFHIYPIEPEICTDVVLIANNFSELSPAGSEFVKIIRSGIAAQA